MEEVLWCSQYFYKIWKIFDSLVSRVHVNDKLRGWTNFWPCSGKQVDHVSFMWFFQKWRCRGKKRGSKWWLWRMKGCQTRKFLEELDFLSEGFRRSSREPKRPIPSKKNPEQVALQNSLREKRDFLSKYWKRKKPQQLLEFPKSSRLLITFKSVAKQWREHWNLSDFPLESRKRSPNWLKNTRRVALIGQRSMNHGLQKNGRTLSGLMNRNSICWIQTVRNIIGQIDLQRSLKIQSSPHWNLEEEEWWCGVVSHGKVYYSVLN